MPFIDPQQIATKEPLPGWRGRFFNSENMTFGYYEVAAGAEIHAHAHPNEEVWHVVDFPCCASIGGVTL
jgi:quercetin dioxygenase-like cupin family protein